MLRFPNNNKNGDNGIVGFSRTHSLTRSLSLPHLLLFAFAGFASQVFSTSAPSFPFLLPGKKHSD
jgi:hypothetical protein